MILALRRGMWTLALAPTLGAFPLIARAEPPGYSDYTRWRDWARWHPGVRAGLISSYDRTGGNNDLCWYESPQGFQWGSGVCTAGTINGPGVIYRFWMPHEAVNHAFPVRMFFDGEATPRIDTTSDALFGGQYSYFASPLTDLCAGGQTCYEPIPFASSLRIETANQVMPDLSLVRHYYQYSFATFAPGTPIQSYTGALSAGEQAARAAFTDMLANVGLHPDAAGASTVLNCAALAVPAATAHTIANLVGPGLIRRINVKMPAASDAELAGLRLVVTYDAEALPAIDVSITDFFGAGFGRATYRSLPIGTDSPDGFYCYWPMPYRAAVRVELRNDSQSPIAVESTDVEYQAGPLSYEMCYLRATANQHTHTGSEIYHTLLTANGRGHYVGNLLYVEQSYGAFAMLEGDDVVTVDGSDVLYGTGLEDAYNGGYYYNWTLIQDGEPEGASPSSATRPLFGALALHREPPYGHGRADQYRWYIGDRIPFSNSIEVKIENQYAVTGSNWTSVAFWYQQPSMLADIDANGVVNASDVSAFVAVLLGLDADDGHVARSDADASGCVDGADIQLFISVLSP